jgi:hypothetical protein
MRATCCLFLGLMLAVTSIGCSPTVDLTKALEIQDVSTGWFDAGIVNGKNKLVPSAVLKLKNLSDQTLPSLQVNAVFRRVTEKDEWGSAFLTAAGSQGLAPGATTSALTFRCPLGYTGTEPRQQMLKNSQFIDVKVELFVKYRSLQWIRLAELPIERLLVTR